MARLVFPLLLTLFPLPWAHAVDWTEFNATVLLSVERSGVISMCSGVAIDSWRILTAAHCVDGATGVTAHGDFGTAKAAPGKIPMRPGYNPRISNYQNDLAIFVLTAELPGWINYPVLRRTRGPWPANLPLERIGYGLRGGANTRTWQSSFYSVTTTEPGALFTKDALTKAGDSGGAVYVRVENRLQLVGIHSTVDHALRDDRGVAVDLRFHRDWLEQTNLPVLLTLPRPPTSTNP